MPLNRNYFAENQFRRGIILLSSIATRNDFTRGKVFADEPVNAKSISTPSHHYVSALHVIVCGGADYNNIVVEDVRLHALTLGAEAYFCAAMK